MNSASVRATCSMPIETWLRPTKCDRRTRDAGNGMRSWSIDGFGAAAVRALAFAAIRGSPARSLPGIEPTTSTSAFACGAFWESLRSGVLSTECPKVATATAVVAARCVARQTRTPCAS